MSKINTDPLESFAKLTSNSLFIKKKITFKGRSSQPSFSIQPHNMICTCELRIRETSNYLNNLQLRRQNDCGEAFSFYEVVNCISIILGCTEALFFCLGKHLDQEYGKEKFFAKSNRKRKGDIAFFKFIRSASSVHPEKTDRHSGLTKSKHEFYPYAIWKNNIDFDKDAPKGYDVKLVYWNSKPNCYSKGYYLFLEEFFQFASHIVSLIPKLNPLVQDIIDNSKEKLRCKTLKSASQFPTRSEYCLYLRKRLEKRKKEEYEFKDGGLLIASHILSNHLLEEGFKDFIFQRVKRIAKKMKEDITEIGFDDIYGDLSLSAVLTDENCHNSGYVDEKYHSYLESETKWEIEMQEFRPFRPSLRNEENNMNYDDAEWAANILLTLVKGFHDIEKLKKAYSFSDLYEITLETIWKRMKELGKL